MNYLIGKFRKVLLFYLLFLSVNMIFAHQSEVSSIVMQQKITGIVKDQLGEPLIGVNVTVKGTTLGAITDIDGHYSIDVPGSDAVLLFSFVGYIPQQVTVGNNKTVNVTLVEDIQTLKELVVVGYGVQKKTTITGAVSTIKGEKLAEVPVANVSQSMAGKVAGISMRPNGGQPGFDSPKIYVRGIVTTGKNSDPLIVVDGIKRDNMNQVDPSSIETITVLKDAAAIAPYGIGGANGVILITTKTGKTGKPVVKVNTSLGFQNPTYMPDVLNAKDYMTLQNEGYYNMTPDGKTPPNDVDLIANYNNLHQSDPYKYPDSRFTEVFKKNILMQNHTFEIGGGTDIVTYHAGFGFFKQDGLFDPIDYKRFNYNMSLGVNASKTTKLTLSIYGSKEHTNQIDPGDRTTDGHLFRAFYKFIPTQALLYPGGDKWGESSANSPMAAINSKGYDKAENNVTLGSVGIEQQLPFIKGLSVKGVFSYDPTYKFEKQWHLPLIYHKIDLNTTPYSFSEAITAQEGGSTRYSWLRTKNTRTYNYTYQGYINYSRTFGDHGVSGLFVAESRQTKKDEASARRNNFAVTIDEMDMGSADKQNFENGGMSYSSSEVGFVYRLGYSYKDRYSLEASGRYDGHYYFAPGHRWGFFPSFSAAWRISEEKFMKKFTSINNLKIRGSWGKSGMLAGDPYQYLAGYILGAGASGDSPGYAFGNGSLVQGSRMKLEANPSITWEISNKTDIGFDLNMWNGLFNLEFDYFHEKRSGMLLKPDVIVPVEYGLALSEENKGKMENNGIEVSLSSSKKLSNGMEISLGATFTYAKNKMVEVFETDAERNNPNRTKYGRPFETPYGYKSLGLFTSADDKNADGIIDTNDGYNIIQFGTLRPGDIRYADLSGPDGVPDGKIDSYDQTVIGHPHYPLMTFGFTPSVSWKGIDLSLFFQGSAMSSISNYSFLTVPFENNGSNTSYEYMDNRWTPEHQNAKYPRATPSPIANNNQESDFWRINTDFLRLKTLSVGYTIPSHFTKKLQIQQLRLFFTAQNLLTFSKLKHIDPEIGWEYRVNAYPVMKSVNFGLDITF